MTNESGLVRVTVDDREGNTTSHEFTATTWRFRDDMLSLFDGERLVASFPRCRLIGVQRVEAEEAASDDDL